MLKVSQDFTVAPYYITFIAYITEPTLFYGWNEEMIWKVNYAKFTETGVLSFK
jgi:hypothetical protein